MEGLPVERYRQVTAEQLNYHATVVLPAPPGSGKTFVLLETGLLWADESGEAVLLTEPTQFAAEHLVKAFQNCRGWCWWGGGISNS